MQLQQVKQESERKHQLAQSIQSQLNNLTGSDQTKAKVALASLYTLAREEDVKAILFTIAIVSQSAELKQTIASLVADDGRLSRELKDRLIAKLGKIVDDSSRGVATPGTASSPDVSTEKRLQERLTQDQTDLVGWIYLGKTPTGGNQLGQDKTIIGDIVPAIDQLVTLQTSASLRELAPTSRAFGSIKGILAKGTEAKVQKIKRKPIDASSEAVWAEVSIND